MNTQAKIAELQARVAMEMVDVEAMKIENTVRQLHGKSAMFNAKSFDHSVDRIRSYADELKLIAEGSDGDE